MSLEDRDAAQFFTACYIAWVVGMLEPEHVAELDAMSPTRWDNWRQIAERESGFDRHELQALFLERCLTMSDDDALNSMVNDLLSRNTVGHLSRSSSTEKHRSRRRSCTIHNGSAFHGPIEAR